MSVLALGLSHRSAPVTLLERVALSGEARLKLMTDMVNTSAVNEVMVVSTCNRTEVYADVDQFHPGVAAICTLLSQYTGVSQEELTKHCYVHYEERAVQHLFSVACGLDSMSSVKGRFSARCATRSRTPNTSERSDGSSTTSASEPCASVNARTPKPTSTRPEPAWSASG